jgi:hypothetical protein
MLVLEPMKPPSARQTSDLRWTRGAAICGGLWGRAGGRGEIESSAFGRGRLSRGALAERMAGIRRVSSHADSMHASTFSLTLADARDTGALAETRLAAIILVE